MRVQSIFPKAFEQLLRRCREISYFLRLGHRAVAIRRFREIGLPAIAMAIVVTTGAGVAGADDKDGLHYARAVRGGLE